MEGRVAWISIAPVKGLGLVSLDSVALTGGGIVEDRRFYVADDRGRHVNGKRHGPLVTVHPEYDEAAQTLALRFSDETVAAGPVELGGPVVTDLYGTMRDGRTVRGPFSEALSEFAGRPVTLVRPDLPAAGHDRMLHGSISLLSTAACDGSDPRRFRMNIGVDGVPAHAEDDWVGYRVRIGDAVVRPTGHTGRCLVTSQHPDTGLADMDMLEHIRRTRPDDTSEPLPFGVHGSVAQPGAVRVGDPVLILR